MSDLEQLISQLHAGATDLARCLSTRPDLSRNDQFQLALADQKFRIRRGEPCNAAHYQSILPWLATDHARITELIVNEFALRLGSTPTDKLLSQFVADYSGSYPSISQSLREWLEQWHTQPLSSKDLDALCDRFEEAVSQQLSPRIEDWLDLAPRV
ncbi:MAG: hypothetical protein MUC83_06410 [Pirellula sp.]|nr:hypothetical protein [Pirellula sp.]